MSGATEHYEVRGLRLAFHRWGDDSRPLLVLLHGFMDHGRSFAPVAELLAKDFFVVAPDFRGHGESGWIGAGGYYHFYDYFHDVRVLVERLGAPRFGLVGHSMGGSVATGLAALLAERVSALVLLEGMGPPFAAPDEAVERLRRWTLAQDGAAVAGDVGARRGARRPMPSVEDAAERLRRANPRLPEARALMFAASFTEAVDGGVAWRFDPLHRTPAAKPFVFEEVAPMWRSLSMPVLSIHGTETHWLPDRLEARHRAVPHLVSALMPGAGHNLHHDRPELVAAAIAAWLEAPPRLAPGITEGEPRLPA